MGQSNPQQGHLNLYSFSWIQNTASTGQGIILRPNSFFFISAWRDDLVRQITEGIHSSPEVFSGSVVKQIQEKSPPAFSCQERFFMNSPILLKKRVGDKVRHMIYCDDEFGPLLTQNLVNKLESVGMSGEGVEITADTAYPFPQTKLVTYKGIQNRTSLLPVLIKGTPEQIAFAWTVGLGNSTGIGFGAVK